jgi:hypothetical protein
VIHGSSVAIGCAREIGLWSGISARDGVADNPIALASLTDLIMTLVLRGISHNYVERLESGRCGAVSV